MARRQSASLAAKETMQRFNYDPLEVLVLHAQEATTSGDVKMDIAKALLPYMYPKLAMVTVDGEVTTNTSAEAQAAMVRRFLDSPELADAAQKLSIAAAEAALEYDLGLTPEGMVQ